MKKSRPRRRHRHHRRAPDRPVHRFPGPDGDRRGHLPQAYAAGVGPVQDQAPHGARRQAGRRRRRQRTSSRRSATTVTYDARRGARARHGGGRLHSGRQREQGEVLRRDSRARRASSPRAASSVSASPMPAASTTRCWCPGRGPLHPDRLLQHAQHHDPDQDALRRRRRQVRLDAGTFVCMRRANDISQTKDFVPAPQVGKHDDAEFGTHHAHDAYHVFETLNQKILNLFSSAVKLNTQYMHSIWFNLELQSRHRQGRVDRAALRGQPAGGGHRQALLPT